MLRALPLLLLACAGEIVEQPRERPSDPNAAEARFVAPPPLAPAPLVRAPVAPTAAHTMMICPMHRSLRKNEPGKCPECGMTLVPADNEGRR